ncbi:MAG: response regulator transcription factor [Chloroflexi bacterium]|nr:response regulator transcription factor [Chloroflexota bacterium]
MRTGRLRIWIDDHNPIYRRGLIACLEQGGFAIAGESERLEAEISADEVDVLLFEASAGRLGEVAHLARGSGVALVAVLRDRHDPTLFDAVEAGVAAILVRDDLSPDSLIAALRTVATGHTAVPAELLARLLDHASYGTTLDIGQREVAVLRALADGADTGEIADSLSYSERMVKRIVHDVLVKMNCRNRAHAVALAVRQGLI